MCGINGAFAYAPNAPIVDVEEVVRVRDAMRNRGPDGEGLWVSADARVAFGHRRLSIIDLSERAAQPMKTSDGRFVITFNGEIYNYQTLRQELLNRGCVMHTTSDTEVILHLYRLHGDQVVRLLRGMYAFAIWDTVERTLFLARDAFGIKPLYYADQGGVFRFSSQVKSLIDHCPLDRSPQPAGHVGFFILGSVPEPYTMYKSVHTLPAGSMMKITSEDRRIVQYFDVAAEFADGPGLPGKSADDCRHILRDALLDSVRHHLVADVPVGIFLSSGLDSSMLAALASEISPHNLHSLTLGFREYRNTPDDETNLAKLVANSVGTVHQTRWIAQPDFEQNFVRILNAMDQPSIDGVNTYFVSQAASQLGMKVALSGLGGDELFAGYPSFRDVPRLVRWLKPFRKHPSLSVALRRLSSPWIAAVTSPKFASLPEYGGDFAGAYMLRRGLYMPWELRSFMDGDFVKRGIDDLDLLQRLASTITGKISDRKAVSALEMCWYMRNQLLRDSDWAGMAHSLEIRVPLVDVELVRRVAPLLASTTPPTKTDAASTPRKPLPESLFKRPKTGFSIPVQHWINGSATPHIPRRRIRQWASVIYKSYKPLRSLALVSDAFGGHGGIALYNRDLLTSLCTMPESSEVITLPRIVSRPVEQLPKGLTYRIDAANNKVRYVKALFKFLLENKRIDIVLCCHINLLVPAVIASLRLRAPLVLFIYGIDAWAPQPLWKRHLLRHVTRIVSISEVTLNKFQSWAKLNAGQFTVLPNAIHSQWYGPGGKSPELLARYDLHDKVVLMTLGRLVSSERYKGFDEVIDALPGLVGEIPNVLYLIAGDGSDRARLEEKVKRLGLSHHVRFTGLIPEHEKADHYRLADAYVMPSRGEGFGFVLLEAMACGVPAVASRLDGGREALRNGTLGFLVDPSNPEDIKRGIRSALAKGRGAPPEGLEFFEYANFSRRAHGLIKDTLKNPVTGGSA